MIVSEANCFLDPYSFPTEDKRMMCDSAHILCLGGWHLNVAESFQAGSSVLNSSGHSGTLSGSTAFR